MSDEFDDFDDDLDDTDPNVPDGQSDREEFRNMRRAARRAKQADSAREAAERELALVKAGIDTETKIGRLFLDSYRGDLSKEAILAEASDIPGLISAPTPPAPQTTDQPTGDTPPPPAATQEPPQVDPKMTDERDALHSGGTVPGQVNESPTAVALQRGVDAMDQGATEEDAMVQIFRTIHEAGASGDERVIWSAEKHAAQQG